MVKCPGCGEENPPKFKLCGYCGTPLHAPAAPALPAHEVRKTVTIVFSDLKDSTALGERIDSEALHEVKERYFAAMSAEIARHGGKVEKYIGDAIMAVFGLPKAHEDDALRAVRAAHGMGAALAKLNEGLRARYGVALANRTGVNTGEVVAVDDPSADQKLATGDAVNVAARLEQAAPADQIYLGETTWQLVRDAVEVEAVEPLALKGKTERVAAYRLVSARGLEGNLRRVDTPLTGREEEVATLDEAWREACATRCVRLVTVVGEAGMGKSRLVHEVVSRHGGGAQVLRGRCLPYGDGITFWPLVEMVGAAAGIEADDSPEQAQARLQALVGEADVAARLASAIGLSTATFPIQEINWAARRFIQDLARRKPVLAIVDDIHWAEPAFLDLLEHVLDNCTDAPVLLLATARHELVEEHPDWPDRANATLLALQPLSAAASEAVVRHLLGKAALSPTVVARIVEAAEGNPLYVEQMLSMLIDSHVVRHADEANALVGMAGMTEEFDDEIIVPPTIHALLEARLDKLAREERATVEPAAVVGVRFAQQAVEALAPILLRPTIAKHLSALHRKQFIDPAEPNDPEGEFRFHHHLVRDTVYNGLLKRARANLHTSFVRWADQINAERNRGLEFEEILGYHLEQAHRYLKELGPLDESGLALGRDGAGRLGSAGRRVLARGDVHAAANLLQRAVNLLEADDPARLALLPDLGEALIELGDFGAVRSLLEQSEFQATRQKAPRVHAALQLLRMRSRIYSPEAGDRAEDSRRLVAEVIPQLEADSAHVELAKAWRMVGFGHGIAARYGESSEAVRRSMIHARLVDDRRLIARNAMGLSISTLQGPTPVADAIVLCEGMLADGLVDRQAESKVLGSLAQLRAMNGEFGLARDLYRRARQLLAELGQGVTTASMGIDLLAVELLAGDLEGAERAVTPDLEFLSRAGETYHLSTIAAMLSRVVRDLGRDADALRLSKIAEENSADDDIESQALWRSVRAPIVARTGDLFLATTLARSAVELASQADAPPLHGDTLSELASVEKLAGRISDARAAIGAAASAYERKGDIVSLARARRWAGTVN